MEPAAEGVGDSLYPLLGNAGYDVLHYDIELDVDPAANTLAALTTITALATEDMAAFNLDLAGLDVHDVTVDSVAAEFSRSGSELTVQPALALVQGEEFSVSVAYSGAPEPINDPGVPFNTLGWHSQAGVIYTLRPPTSPRSTSATSSGSSTAVWTRTVRCSATTSPATRRRRSPTPWRSLRM